MSKNTFRTIALIILLILSIRNIAQVNSDHDIKVEDILDQMPKKNLVLLDKVLNELIELGPEGFQKVTDLLTPPGAGDDTNVRFALNSLSRYASQFDKIKERNFVEENLIIALKKQSNVEVKTFLLNQLNLVGGNKTIDEIKEYLSDEELCEPAAQTLISIDDKSAANELLFALKSAKGNTKATLVKALGNLKCVNAIEQITPLIHSNDTAIKKSALAALANIGSPSSFDNLLEAAESVKFKYDPTNSAEAFIIYANRLGEQNKIDLLKEACEEIFNANTSAEQLHNYSSGLAIYAKYLGYEVTPLLLEALNNGDKAFRYSVLNIAANIGGIADTRKWIDEAKLVSSEIQSEIISMLGRRGDEFAVDFIIENLNSSSSLVREESITALTKLQGSKAIKPLIEHLVKGNDIESVKSVLMQLLDKDHLRHVAEKLELTEDKTKAGIIDIISSKGGTKYFNEIFSYTASKNNYEKTAAFNALKNISTENNLDELLQLLLNVQDSIEIQQTQLAVIAAAENAKSEQRKTGKILTSLEKTDKKERIIPILSKIGGKETLEIVSKYFNTSTGAIQDAAFTALTNWKDYSAANKLYEISKTANGSYQQKAVSDFIQIINSAKLPDDQKLLQFRKIMPYAKSESDRKLIIRSIGNLKTFLSLIYLEQYLNDEELRQDASRSIIEIAHPNDDQNNGFTGNKVRELLEKTKTIISGEDSQDYITEIESYLENMPIEIGFVSMFNGVNLEGWEGLVGDPISRSKMSKIELTKKQIEANKKMLENWSVKDGLIIFNGKGENLCSIKDYGDFELILDWRITKEGDSGIYLRGTPQVQIWDTSRVESGAQVGSGGLYNNQKHISKPLKVADNPIDEWNTFHITMIGANVTVYLNGELVVDNVPMDNYWDQERPIFETEAIELQAHGNQLAFRNIYVREINTKEIGLTKEEKEEGFESLFNGKNLDGWQGNKIDYYAENDELIVDPKKGGHGNLYTAEEYSDFNLRFEFQLTPGANNGIGVRAPLEGDAAYAGMELQILDNEDSIYANLQPYQYHGSVYGVIPAKRGFLNPVGDWNSEEIILNGTKVKVTLNGKVIVEGDIAEASKNGTLDHKDHPGINRSSGYIGFLGHGSELKFRNLRIKDLSK
ncbi:MAG: DUF1080 domain-containing protein [Ignavibacteriales bacterium]|nr:DUF1080 domain-containing protein [Ignavibacteriales bacterium]